jgi:glycosyltransferase involved in cell wall biosynthesis
MKIGVNGRTFSVDEPDGAVQTSVRLTRGLSELGNQVTVFGSQHIDGLPDSINLNSTGYPFKSQVYGTIWERTLVPALLRREALDVFYSPNGNGPLHEVSTPTVMRIHDVNAQFGMSSMTHQFYRKTTVPRAAKAADLITTVSNFSKKEICNVLSIPESKVRVVYNGIDDYYLDEKESKQMNVPESYILFVGAMNPRKNIERIIKSFKKAKRIADIPHKLLLVGPKNNIVFKNLEISDSRTIKHLGYLPKENLKYVYEQADCLLYPSLYEGFGIPPLEAMACGTPVIGSKTGALPEILGDAAELPDPHDGNEICETIIRLLEDDDRRKTLTNRGRKRSELFKWKKSINKLQDVCEEATQIS